MQSKPFRSRIRSVCGALCLCMLAVAGCSGPADHTEQALEAQKEGEPFAALERLTARELEVLPDLVEVTLMHAEMQTRVPATDVVFRKRDVHRSEDALVVSIDVGTASPIECWVTSDSFAPALHLAELTRAYTENLRGEWELLPRHSRTDAGVVAGTPYLAVEWTLVVNPGGKGRLKAVKHRIADLDDVVVRCTHHELGYSKALRTVFESFVANFDAGDGEEGPPGFRSVVISERDGQKVGYELREIFDSSEDRLLEWVTSSSLDPSNPRALSPRDFMIRLTVDRVGRIVDGSVFELADFDLVTGIALSTAGESRWRLRGELRGTDLEREFELEPPLYGPLGLTLAARQSLATGEAGELSSWSPDLDPTRPQPVVIGAPNAEGGSTVRLGSLDALVHFDEHGNVQTMTVPGGIVARTVLVEGQEELEALLSSPRAAELAGDDGADAGVEDHG